MAFDAGFLRCVLREIDSKLAGARVEKVLQPEKDEIVLQTRSENGNRRLLLSASPGSPRVHLTETREENPLNPPTFCMLLRKHLTGARFVSASQIGFERAYTLVFEGRDEMGFPSRRLLIGEIMGKCSNLMLCDGEKRILSPLKAVDFTTSSRRQVLPGMLYEPPPPQDKIDPLTVSREEIASLLAGAPEGEDADRFLASKLLGVSLLVARELVYSATGDAASKVSSLSPALLYSRLLAWQKQVEGAGEPYLILSPAGEPVEYSFLPVGQYGRGYLCRKEASFSSLIDLWYGEKDRKERLRQKTSELNRLLSTNVSRLVRKISLLRGELKDCEKKEIWKKRGDLLTANLYLLGKGKGDRKEEVVLTDYESGDEVTVPLDIRLSPAENAQRYYKKYAKAKRSEVELTKQIALAERDLTYLNSVADSLERTGDASGIAAIRRELESTGYVRKRGKTASRKETVPSPFRYPTAGGLTVLCGRNNSQNDEVTFRLAEKNDYWFHVKNAPGSHAVLLCRGETPSEEDLTFAASIAALHSSLRKNGRVEVQYTRVREIRKPAGSPPGFVIFDRYKSAVVAPAPENTPEG